MQKSRLIIFQVLGIMMLMCGYFLSDQPDSESVMHFDLTVSHEINAVDHNTSINRETITIAPDDHPSRKLRGNKHFSFKVILPKTEVVYHPVVALDEGYARPLAENYYYLFFKEINPPPPKSC